MEEFFNNSFKLNSKLDIFFNAKKNITIKECVHEVLRE